MALREPSGNPSGLLNVEGENLMARVMVMANGNNKAPNIRVTRMTNHQALARLSLRSSALGSGLAPLPFWLLFTLTLSFAWPVWLALAFAFVFAFALLLRLALTFVLLVLLF